MLDLLSLQAVAVDQRLHLPRDYGCVMAKDFDALEGKQPARIG
jgi:hypothetical protein